MWKDFIITSCYVGETSARFEGVKKSFLAFEEQRVLNIHRNDFIAPAWVAVDFGGYFTVTVAVVSVSGLHTWNVDDDNSTVHCQGVL